MYSSFSFLFFFFPFYFCVYFLWLLLKKTLLIFSWKIFCGCHLSGNQAYCVIIRQQVITGSHYICGACFYVHPMQVKQVTHFAVLQIVVRLDSRDGVKRKVWAARFSGIGLNSVSPSEKLYCTLFLFCFVVLISHFFNLRDRKQC